MSDQQAHPKTSNLQITLTAVAGFMLLIAILCIAAFSRDIQDRNYELIRAVLAIACAAFAALIPGFIDVKYRNVLRAGGALGVFGLIYLNPPVVKSPPTAQAETAALSQQADMPKEDAGVTALSWLKIIDGQDYTAAWEALNDQGRVEYPKNVFINLNKQWRQPLGAVVSREFINYELFPESPMGQKGIFAQVEYKTHYRNGPGFWRETVIIEAVDGKWVPYGMGFHECMGDQC